MKVAVVGAGALATLFAARLARAGTAVTMAGTWPEGLQALSEAAIVEEDGGAWSTRVTAVPRQDLQGHFEVVVVLVKAWATTDVAPVVARVVRADSLVLTLQNGLGNREILAAAVPAGALVSAGITTNGSTLLSPGRVRAFPGQILLDAAPRLDPASALLGGAGFGVGRSDAMETALWRKLAVNCAINPMTAMRRITNGELATRGEWLIAAEAAREVQQVARANGVPPDGDWVDNARDVALSTYSNRSSMLQDVERGRPTEIDAICGHVVREGARLGVPTPVNARLLRSLS